MPTMVTVLNTYMKYIIYDRVLKNKILKITILPKIHIYNHVIYGKRMKAKYKNKF